MGMENDDARPTPQDWDPRAPEVLTDQIAAYDAVRRRCPVAYSDFLGWTVFEHADALRVVHDHETFSNVVSRHLSVPNGMDPPAHTPHRRINERYFTDDRMAAFEPTCRLIAAELVEAIPRGAPVEVMEAGTLAVEAVPDAPPEHASYPAGGYSSVVRRIR